MWERGKHPIPTMLFWAMVGYTKAMAGKRAYKPRKLPNIGVNKLYSE